MLPYKSAIFLGMEAWLWGESKPMKLAAEAAENTVDGRNPAPAGMYKTL